MIKNIVMALATVFSLGASSYAIDKKYLDAVGVQRMDITAPDFTLKEANGRVIHLKDYKGKVVVLHFWATWCTPCRTEFPLFDGLYKSFKDKGMVFLPIAIDPRVSREEIDTLAKSFGASFPVYLAHEGKVTDKYWTWGVPVTYFIDKNGMVAGRAIGPRDWASQNIGNLVDELLKEK
ncbi:MAG: TlpA family protein disulfide reductase [Deltaproteobacteria bacterium]|nr:TlpA family protein disulfide reductase [Deltaproteobacteria bacterium]